MTLSFPHQDPISTVLETVTNTCPHPQPWSNFWQPPGISPSAKDTVQNSRYKILDINLIHPIRLSQVAITYFASHNRPGSIIHISSIAGQWPIFPTPMYSASKHAISGFVRSISALANPPSGSGVKPIRVVAVAPGVIKTPLWTDHPEKLKFVDESKDVWVSPEEVAEGMFSVLTDEGKYESGTILEIGKGTRREVKMINDPGFSGVGMTVSELGKGVDEVWASLGGMGKH
jgi:3-hydroxybutyrate dehydrogenase